MSCCGCDVLGFLRIEPLLVQHQRLFCSKDPEDRLLQAARADLSCRVRALQRFECANRLTRNDSITAGFHCQCGRLFEVVVVRYRMHRHCVTQYQVPESEAAPQQPGKNGARQCRRMD